MGFLDMYTEKMKEDMKKYDVFIIHSPKDKEFARHICSILEESKLNCFISPRNILTHRRYSEVIEEGIYSSKMVLVIFSKNSQESKIVKNELELAYKYNQNVIALDINQTVPQCELNLMMKNLQWIELKRDSEEIYGELVKKVRDLCFKTQKEMLIDAENIEEMKIKPVESDIKPLLLLIGLTYPFAFIYYGIVGGKKEWLLLGIIFFVPFPFWLYSLGGDIINASKIALLVQWYIVYWIIAIIYGLLIRKEFLVRKSFKKIMPTEDKLYDIYIDEFFDYFP